MKRSDLIPWFLFALVIPAAVSGQSELSVAAEAETPSTAPLTGPLTVQVQDSGRVVVFDNHRLTAFWMPELFLKGWQIVFFKAPGRNQQCDAVATLPDGTEVMLNISIKVGPSKLTFHATMTPSKDTHVISVRELILLPYEDWVGDAYVAGDVTSTLPKDVVHGNGNLVEFDHPILLGPSHRGGLTVRLEAPKLHGVLQDVRQWWPNLSVYYTHGEPEENEWLWKAGDTKTFDCTMTFNREVATQPVATVQDIDVLKARIDALVKPIIEGGWVPGMAVGLRIRGKNYVWGYGKTSLPDGRTPDGDTEYEIGSITKLFTKLLFSDMVHRKRMALDDRAQAYLPPTVKLPTKDGKEITLLNLSNHTSGLRKDPETWDIHSGDSYAGYTLEQFYDYLNHCELLSAPGQKFFYSDTGVALLGDLIAKENGTSWANYLRQRILDPLGMKDTATEWTRSQKERAAQGYDGDGNPWPLWEWKQSPFMSMGGLHSTVNDLLKLGQAALAKTSSPLDDIAFDEMAEKLDWGRVVTHDGATYGFNASFYVDRENQTILLVLGNMMNGIVPRTAWHIRNLMQNKLSPAMEFPVFTELPVSALKPYVGRYRFTHVPDSWGPKPEEVYEFYLKEGKLYGRGGHGWVTNFRIYPLANGNFYQKKGIDESLKECVFTKDAKGRVTGYTMKDQRAFTAEKLAQRQRWHKP
jgi:CubicO group peptidase (beta-lactamase class C family)